jgi:hypothetical protein
MTMKINKSHKKVTCKHNHSVHLEGTISILYLGYVTNVSTGILERNAAVALFQSRVAQSTVYTVPLLQSDEDKLAVAESGERRTFCYSVKVLQICCKIYLMSFGYVVT